MRLGRDAENVMSYFQGWDLRMLEWYVPGITRLGYSTADRPF
jgi:hypothetical protein